VNTVTKNLLDHNQQPVSKLTGLIISEVRLAVGDELRLRYRGEMQKPWECVGHVIKIPNSMCNVAS
jgi:hypothetical protein